MRYSVVLDILWWHTVVAQNALRWLKSTFWMIAQDKKCESGYYFFNAHTIKQEQAGRNVKHSHRIKKLSCTNASSYLNKKDAGDHYFPCHPFMGMFLLLTAVIILLLHETHTKFCSLGWGSKTAIMFSWKCLAAQPSWSCTLTNEPITPTLLCPFFSSFFFFFFLMGPKFGLPSIQVFGAVYIRIHVG